MSEAPREFVRRFVQGNERWPGGSQPSAKLRAPRPMPHWITARGSAVPPPPPPPPDIPPPIEPEYEVIDFPGQQTYSNQPAIRSKEKEKKRCDLCGSSAPAVKCMQCVQQNFCYSCDDMYHRHPKRQSHIRKELDGGGGRPPLPPKGEPPPAPVPPPRRNKRATPRPTPPPPHLPQAPHPHTLQRESVSPKPGFVGSLKRMIGARPLPMAPYPMDRQNSLPPSSSMMNFHEQHMLNGFQDWSETPRGHRSGSFSNHNPPAFGQMMQAQSMAQLNCPSCHGHGMWNPWSGMPPNGTWQSSAMLSRGNGRDDWSDSDSDSAWQRERLRRFSTMSARAPRSYGCDDTLSVRGGRRTDVETSSHKGGRRRDFDTMSIRGGKKQDFDTMSNRGGRKQDFDTMSNRGGRKQDFDTMSLRGGRRSDLESPSFRSERKFNEERHNKNLNDNRYKKKRNESISESSEERESDDDFITTRRGRKVLSDLEDVQRNRRRSEPVTPVQHLNKTDSTLRKKNRRDERFTDTGRRRSSPVSHKYESPSGEEEEEHPALEIKEEPNEKGQNGIEIIEDNPEEEELGPIPDTDWECMHCTFVNEGGSRVCAVCCKTTTKPKPKKPQETSPPELEDEVKKKLSLEDKTPKVDPHPPKEKVKPKEKTEKMKEKRGEQSPERNRTLTSTGTSPPPQSISTQTYEEGGRKLTRATSLADYSDWKPPQRSASRHSLLSDTQSLPVTPPGSRSPDRHRPELGRRSSDLFSHRSLKRAGSQPPEYITSLVQKQVKQGLEMVKLLREAEENQFSAEDLAVALVHCGDDDPITWLQDNWRNMIDTVVTLGTNYGQERKENTVGTISASEAREALRAHDGNVWAAVTECVEQRQRKYAELLSRGNFSREDIVTVLTANHGNLEEAYKELNKNQLKPFLMRIWGPPQGVDNDDGDFTKLAHGEVEGRGGKNSEEVSVDLSIDSNYDRIQSWLEEYVHTNNKRNLSQSMLQLNLGGLKRSESEWKVNSINNSRSNSNIFKNRRNSDIQRYLTNLYNSNDKSLLIKKHSTSTQNLLKLEKSDPIVNASSEKTSESQSSKILPKNNLTEDNKSGEIETITIMLSPTIVKREDYSQRNNNEDQSSDSSSEESESSETDSGSSDDEQTHDNSNTLRGNIQRLQVDNKLIKESSSVSSEKSSTKPQELSKSESQSSNESFESIHSSTEDREKSNEKSAISKQNLQKVLTRWSDRDSNVDNKEVNSPVRNLSQSREASIEYESHDYANVIIRRASIEEQENEGQSDENVQKENNFPKVNNQLLDSTTSSVGGSSEVLNEGLINKTDQRESMSISRESLDDVPYKGMQEKPDEKENDAESSLSSNEDSQEEYEEVMTDDEIPPFIEEIQSIPISEKIQIKFLTPTEAPEEENDSEYESNFLPNDVHSNGKKQKGLKESDNRSQNRSLKNNNNLIVPNKRRIISRKQKEYYAMSKSDSDVNEEQSIDFSEESVDYKEGRRLSPNIAISLKRDPSLRFSEGNSDKDISSIPTDSERESFHDGKNNLKEPNENNKTFHSDQAELIELLKKSLAKDDVVERLVSTLFASVLQASVEGNVFKEHKLNKKTNEFLINHDQNGTNDELRNHETRVHHEEQKNINDQHNKEMSDAIPIDEENKNYGIKTLEKQIVNERVVIQEPKPIPNLEVPNEIHEVLDIPFIEENLQSVENEEVTKSENTIIEVQNKVIEVVNEVVTKSGKSVTQVPHKIIEVKNEEVTKSENTVIEVQNTSIELVNEGITKSENTVIEVQNGSSEVVNDLKTKSENTVTEVQNTTTEMVNEELCNSFETKEIPTINNNIGIDSEQQIHSSTNAQQEVEEETSVNFSDIHVISSTVEEEQQAQSEIFGIINEESNGKEEKLFNPEREARRLLAEGLVATYQQAEIAVQLKELNLEDEMILVAAKECSSLEAAVAFLQQECQLCAGKYSVKHMVSMLECEHRCCMECAINYFTLQITERSINDCVCPFCKEPDILHIEEDKALTYFSNLDIFLKGIVKENIHELFQRKLRDRTLMQDPNFKWCVKCSSGFIANPRQKRLVCPDCKAITCAKCMKPWEKEHETMSCEEYKAFVEKNDPDNQLAEHLDEHGVTCPNCRSKYILAKGGCMHLTCPQCKHEFCSGCTKPFLMGKKCTVSEYCEKLGLHSHHPRNCLFYLRDKEPEELEKLLEDNKVDFRNNTEPNLTKRCGIQMLKETSDGLVEGICGYATLKAGLCRTHYIESLVKKVQLNKVDPVKLLDFGEALQELRRHGKTPPERPTGMSEFNYRQICFKVIEEEIPLD